MREAIISKAAEVPPATGFKEPRKYGRIFAAAKKTKKGDALRVGFGSPATARSFYNNTRAAKCWKAFTTSLRGTDVYLTKGGK